MSDKRPDPLAITRAQLSVVIFDVYAGLRRIGYTRDGAIRALMALGVSPEHALDAATTHLDVPAKED